MKLNTLLVTGFLLLTLQACKKTDPVVEPVTTQVTMGAILDLTGNYSEEGLNGKAAIDLALAELNAIHRNAGSGVQFSVRYTDTQMDTLKTLQAAKDFYGLGIRLLVAGPNNSAELSAIKPFLDQNAMLSLCCFSSSTSLAIFNDNIFRLITDDYFQGRALFRMMVTDSLSALIVLWRDDTYGNGLYSTVRDRFENWGGSVSEGYKYQPVATDYDAMIQQVETTVGQAVAVHGTEHTGVLLISYQEAAGFLHAAAGHDLLSRVRWYGCDANVQKSSVIQDTVAAGFAKKVRFVAPIMGIGTADGLPPRAASLSSRIQAITGSVPDAYALSAFDAVMILGQCYNLVRRNEALAVKAVLPDVCSAYNYLGIGRSLNSAGDLESANYIFWSVGRTSGGTEWTPYCTWFADGDYIMKKNR